MMHIVLSRVRQHLVRDNSDHGMSLVELIVAMAVSALLLGVIATIFFQGIVTQQQQASRDLATGQLNAASSLINESLRNSVTAQVADGGARLDMMLVNGKVGAGASYECRSLQIFDGQLWHSEGAGAQGALNMSTWSALVGGLADPASGSDLVGFADAGGNSFNYFFNVRDGDIEVSIRDGGYVGVIGPVGGTACW